MYSRLKYLIVVLWVSLTLAFFYGNCSHHNFQALEIQSGNALLNSVFQRNVASMNNQKSDFQLREEYINSAHLELTKTNHARTRSATEVSLAVIFVGGGNWDKNSLNSRERLGQLAYKTLLKIEYPPENILFLIGGEPAAGTNEIRVTDNEDLFNKFLYFINSKKNYNKVVYYFIAKSDESSNIFINSNNTTNFQNLSYSMGSLSKNIFANIGNSKFVFILESENANRVLDYPDLYHDNYYVITSGEVKETQHYPYDLDAVTFDSFSYQFWNHILINRTLGIAFYDTRRYVGGVALRQVRLSASQIKDDYQNSLDKIKTYCLSFYGRGCY